MSPATPSLASVLSSMAQTLESSEDRAGRVRRVLRLLNHLVPYERCAVMSTRPGAEPEFFILSDTAPEQDLPFQSRLGALLALVSEQTSEEGNAVVTAPGETSHLSVPLIGLDAVVGLLFVEHSNPDVYDTQALQILAVVGSQLGNYLTLERLLSEQARTNEELRRANAFQQLLVGVVGHDLRTPLSAITLAASVLLRRWESDPRSVTTLGRIISSANRAGRITHNLLDLTRVRLGTGIPIVRAATPLREFLEEAIAESQLSHPDRTITLSAPTEPLMADVDADRFAQVVGNLLANATAYSPPETAVSVRLRTWEAETFQLEVHNTGQPIPSTVIRTIFDPFKRGDVADRKGLGLGLYIVHAVVNAHAGRIDVESSESHGTTFRIVMPLRAPPEPPSQAEDPRKGT